MTGPAIILVEPQLGQNIGAAARVMLNFGLTDLRLVAPRDGWPSAEAETLSAGAFAAGVRASIFGRTVDALADLAHVHAATARPRGFEKPVLGPMASAAALQRAGGTGTGVLFGGESSGLSNEDVSLAGTILTFPVNPAFSSLNLAMAVGVFAQAWGEVSLGTPPAFPPPKPPASREELAGMFGHFEAELERAGYFYPPEKTPVMIRNLRAAFIRADWTSQEVRTFRGAVKALARGRGKSRAGQDGR